MTIDAAGGQVPEITLGWRLRIARETAGMDQQQLHEATGIARNTISNYENGATNKVKPLYLRTMALALGVDPTWLETGQAPRGNGGPDGVAGPGFEPGTSGLRARQSRLTIAA